MTGTGEDFGGVVDPSVETGTLKGEQRLCPGCGRPETSWTENGGAGYAAEDGGLYCCRGCADETGCTCSG